MPVAGPGDADKGAQVRAELHCPNGTQKHAVAAVLGLQARQEPRGRSAKVRAPGLRSRAATRSRGPLDADPRRRPVAGRRYKGSRHTIVDPDSRRADLVRRLRPALSPPPTLTPAVSPDEPHQESSHFCARAQAEKRYMGRMEDHHGPIIYQPPDAHERAYLNRTAKTDSLARNRTGHPPPPPYCCPYPRPYCTLTHSLTPYQGTSSTGRASRATPGASPPERPRPRAPCAQGPAPRHAAHEMRHQLVTRQQRAAGSPSEQTVA